MEAALYQGVTPDTADNYHLIANSFVEFLDCLTEHISDESDEPTGVLGKEAPGKEGMLEELTRRKDAEMHKK